MQQRLTAAEGNDSCAESCQKIDATKHFRRWYRVGNLVVFVAVCAGEIAAPDWNNVSEDWMVAGFDRLTKHPRLAKAALERSQLSDSRGQSHLATHG
jgi:hypothetical protein